MASDRPHPESALEQESALNWGFLEDEREACAVVSSRMELVYLNAPARELVPIDWFAKRCFEVFPTVNERCAFGCRTLAAVQDGHAVDHCEESLLLVDGSNLDLDVAIVFVGERAPDAASAVLVLRKKSAGDQEAARGELSEEALALRARLASRFRIREAH